MHTMDDKASRDKSLRYDVKESYDVREMHAVYVHTTVVLYFINTVGS